METQSDTGFMMLMLLYLLLPAVFWVWSLIWVWRDCRRRRLKPWIITPLIAIAGWPVSLLLSVVLRPKPPLYVFQRGETR